MLIALESTGLHFYPRPPRGGRRARPAPTRTSMVFLSTPSARRATLIAKHGSPSKGDFYPRPPRGGRLSDVQSVQHAQEFLSTPSARRATAVSAVLAHFITISIHALREEGDPRTRWASPRHFYPRPPRGGRHAVIDEDAERLTFLSTPSARRATRYKSSRPLWR